MVNRATRAVATCSAHQLSLGSDCPQSKIGEGNPDIFYTDKAGYRNRECLSLGCDDEPLLAGRTPVEVYSDFIEAFSDSFDSMFGALAVTMCLAHTRQTLQRREPPDDATRCFSLTHVARDTNLNLNVPRRSSSLTTVVRMGRASHAQLDSMQRNKLGMGHAGEVITEVTVGMGPAGELRYPSYPEGDGRWRFPGVGEFQCYDAYMLADLKREADLVGEPEWCASAQAACSAKCPRLCAPSQRQLPCTDQLQTTWQPWSGSAVCFRNYTTAR